MRSAAAARSAPVAKTPGGGTRHIADGSPHAVAAGCERTSSCQFLMNSRYDSTKLRTSSRFIASANASANARFVLPSVRRRMANDVFARSHPAR